MVPLKSIDWIVYISMTETVELWGSISQNVTVILRISSHSSGQKVRLEILPVQC